MGQDQLLAEVRSYTLPSPKKGNTNKTDQKLSSIGVQTIVKTRNVRADIKMKIKSEKKKKWWGGVKAEIALGLTHENNLKGHWVAQLVKHRLQLRS